ncbi:MAG TPA: uroporphyrinogen-III C-methyltransferase [Burkholderiales bacterium]|nr:uroporphyrinogen-III C-methyltransferase [Burkholderiales bacterium]
MTGTVYLVGAGPGAADLLTVRAARLLEQADIVFHDALVHPDTLALARNAVLVAVGKRCGRLSTAQRFINKQLIDAAARYRTVVRLKGGDPMLFGRAQEEIDALRAAGVAVEIVPGVSAAFGASADLAQSLTERGLSRSVVFVTPRAGEGETQHDWARPAAAADTVVLYMAGKQAQAIRDSLLHAGLPASRPAVFVENASLPAQRVVPARLGELIEAAALLGDGPALLVVGEVYESIVAAAERETNALRRTA